MRRKRVTNILFSVTAFSISIFLFLKNIKGENFWSASFIQILTLLVTAALSFFFVQKLTDKRRKIDFYLRILDEIQIMVDNSIIFSTNKEALVMQKSVANKIKHLKEHAFVQIKPDMTYIEEQFEELRDLFGNHNQSDEELKRIEPDMIKHKTNISDKIDKIKLELCDI